MSNLVDVTDGWTGTLGPFTLKVDGVALDLTGMTVVPYIHTSLGTLVTLGGTLTVLNQGTNPGQVTYAPAATDFQFEAGGNLIRQPYKIHFKVTDSLGKIVSFPNGAANEISVYQL